MSNERAARKRTHESEVTAESKHEKLARLFQILITAVILAVYGYFLAHPANLATGDLGRHLKNGELFVESSLIAKTNLYSYTYPDQPFINHHWGSGVIFYWIKRAVGFQGLSLVFIAISVITLFIFFNLAAKYSSFAVAAPLAVIAIPVLITRHEARPELFSYLLSGVFLYVLWGYKHGKLGFGWLCLLPILELFWVNLHIYFFIGIMLIAVFVFELLMVFFTGKSQDNNARLNGIAFVGFLTILVTCLNPAGIDGARYPFIILNEYHFPVLENYSIGAVLSAGFKFLPLIYFLIQFGLLCLSWIYVLMKDRSNCSLGDFILTVISSAMAWWGIRNFALFAYLALPLTAINFRTLLEHQREKSSPGTMLKTTAALVVTSAALILINPVYFFSGGRGGVGLGLKEANHAAADFFLKENLQGPIFNNYDVGGYLIHHLYPKHKIFVDNRPETYPVTFFRDVYFPLQMNEQTWATISDRFGFNVIVFNHRDRSSSGEQFIVRRVLDPAWAPVFLDKDIIILLKRYGPNHLTVTKHELTKDEVLTRSN
jgi:hypothetical protein